MKDIRESIKVLSKSFTLNMEEINYDKLIEFLQDMKSKNELYIKIKTKIGTTNKWEGYSVSKDGNNQYNMTNLS